VSLKNSIERELHTEVRLRAGAPGSLRVLVDGRQIFSKQQARRSPNPAEIVQLIREKSPQQ